FCALRIIARVRLGTRVSELLLPGLDASNPLAYLAALGTLQVLNDSAEFSDGHGPWRLSWREEGRWQAVLHGAADIEAVVHHLHTDVMSWSEEPALQIAYDAEGKRLPPSADKATFDLKPLPEAFRSFVDE